MENRLAVAVDLGRKRDAYMLQCDGAGSVGTRRVKTRRASRKEAKHRKRGVKRRRRQDRWKFDSGRKGRINGAGGTHRGHKSPHGQELPARNLRNMTVS